MPIASVKQATIRVETAAGDFLRKADYCAAQLSSVNRLIQENAEQAERKTQQVRRDLETVNDRDALGAISAGLDQFQSYSQRRYAKDYERKIELEDLFRTEYRTFASAQQAFLASHPQADAQTLARIDALHRQCFAAFDQLRVQCSDVQSKLGFAEPGYLMEAAQRLITAKALELCERRLHPERAANSRSGLLEKGAELVRQQPAMTQATHPSLTDRPETQPAGQAHNHTRRNDFTM